MPIQEKFPEKLVIEPTTRCNFKCDMCVKQSAGCRIPEGDMTETLLLECRPLLPHASSLIFTGIGEPLLHPNLEHYIAEAEKRMPANATIGFQTNGKLLNRERAEKLLSAGLNKICISVDSVMPERFKDVREGGTLQDVHAALDALAYARQQVPGHRLKTGIEFVLMDRNLDELPGVVAWADQHRVDFIIVTHLTAYEKAMETEQVFLNNSHEAVALFQTYRDKAVRNGLDIMAYSPEMVKFYSTAKEQALCELVSNFKGEGLEKDLYVNLFNLLAEKPGQYERIRSVFDKAVSLADRYGISLSLPAIRPKTDRYCRFVEGNTMFITWQGQVSPCYFLWHHYTTQRMGYTKYVDPVYFGNVMASAPDRIWQSEAFSGFRQKVKQYDYPNCHAWCEKRCDYVLEEPFSQDCYINDIPCCDCHWCLGLLNCMV